MKITGFFRNQSINLSRKSIAWFLYDESIRFKLVNLVLTKNK